MDVCEILIVEDDAHTRESWARDIRDFNRVASAPFKVHATFATTKREAFQALARTRLDCAVIDLRLPDGEDESGAAHPLGNDVLRKLLEEVGIPAVVYSGYENEASDLVRSSNIRVESKKGGAGAKILASFADQAELMDAMEATRSRIARETARLFNQSIWRRWQTRWSTEPNKDLIQGVIVRQTASHIADALAQQPVEHHPDEFYVVPALFADRLDTGDLVNVADEVQVVLTPRCNLANKAPTHLVLAVCCAMPEWAEWKDRMVNGNATKRDKAERAIRDHATQGHGAASHFLPPLDGSGPWLVDFQEVRTVPAGEIPSLLKCRFASIAPHFIPNLVQRYSSYLGRIGQPDISTEVLVSLCKR
jgi:CheY-like chemotaxis protein